MKNRRDERGFLLLSELNPENFVLCDIIPLKGVLKYFLGNYLCQLFKCETTKLENLVFIIHSFRGWLKKKKKQY